MKINKSFLINLIKEEISSLYDVDEEETETLYDSEGEEESVFKERYLSHEISKTLGEISRYIEKATKAVTYPTDMDTIEIQVKQLKNWEDILTKFLMAIGG